MKWFVLLVGPELLMLTGLGLGIASLGFEKSAGIPPTEERKTESRKKRNAVDCGPAALYVLCQWDGKTHSFEELRKRAHTSIVGTDMLSLKNAAIALGFHVRACKCSFRDLWEHVSQPKRYAILHSSKSHYAPIVRAVGTAQLRIVDSNLGVRDLTEAELTQVLEWDGAALLLVSE